MSADGSLDLADGELNRETCLVQSQSAEIDAQDGHAWQFPPVWHSEMGVCDPGEA